MKTISAGTSGVVINIDSACTLLTPPTGASNVDTTTMFSFTNGSGTGVHFAHISPTGLGGTYFQIITTGTSFTIPNLSAYGYTLGNSGTTYGWVVLKSMDINSTNDFCSQFSELNPSIVATTLSGQFTFTSR